MNEPKKRGRPSKAEVAAREALRVDLTAEAMADETGFDRPPFVSEQNAEFTRRRAQAYARRVWSGQSDSLPEGERRWRVQKALESQGLSMECVVLP